MALGDIDAHFAAWHAWHLRHWAGSGGAPGLGDMDLHFAWQAWHLVTSTLTLRGGRGTYGAGPPLVAHRVPKGRRGRCGSLRGRRGTWRHGRAFCVAGVATW